MCNPFDRTIVDHFDGWLGTTDARDVIVMGALLREAQHQFVFEQPAFVSQFLGCAKQFGRDALSRATNDLFAASVTGVKSGVPGQPFQRDLDDKAEAQKRMDQLSRLSPEYELYRMIKASSELEIATSHKQAELFEE